MNKENAITLLVDEGYKITQKRKDILDFFAKQEKYFTAKNLHEYMESKYPGISFDTVYRNLHLYHDLGILESTDLNAEKNFRMNCGHEHHHHFICNRCGKTKNIEYCPMITIEGELAQCEILGHKFEIYGLCPNCVMAS